MEHDSIPPRTPGPQPPGDSGHYERRVNLPTHTVFLVWCGQLWTADDPAFYFPPSPADQWWRRTPSKPTENTTESGLGKPPTETNTDPATAGTVGSVAGPGYHCCMTCLETSPACMQVDWRESLAVSACLLLHLLARAQLNGGPTLVVGSHRFGCIISALKRAPDTF